MIRLLLVATLLLCAGAARVGRAELRIRETQLACHRLPTNVKPLSYEANLTFASLDSETFEGLVRIALEFNPTKPRLSLCGLEQGCKGGSTKRNSAERELDCVLPAKSNRIVLHADESLNIQDISMTSESIFGDSETSRKVAEVLRDRSKQMLSIKLKRWFGAKVRGTLTIKFKGVIAGKSGQGGGVFVSTYKDGGNKEYKQIVSQFIPSAARTVLPCFDEPHFKVPLQLTISHPDDLTAYSNTAAKSTTVGDAQTKLRTTTFEPTPDMPIHMAAFAVGQFDEPLEVERRSTVLGKRGATKIRVITTPGRRSSGQFALEVAEKALAWFEDYFQFQYPLDKLDVIAIAGLKRDNSESWGLAFVRDTLLWIDEETKPEAKISTAVNVAHVVAHQWFGNLITARWWDDLWITEGVAAQMAFNFVDRHYRSMDIDYVLRLTALAATMDADQSGQAHALSPPLESLASSKQISAIFDQLEFMKSASLAQMIAEATGGWYQILMRKMLAEHAYATITSEEYEKIIWKYMDDAYVSAVQSYVLRSEVPGATVSEAYTPKFTKSAIVRILQTFPKFQGVPVINVLVNRHDECQSLIDSFHKTIKWPLDKIRYASEIYSKQPLILYTNRQYANVDTAQWRWTKPVLAMTIKEPYNTDFYISPAWHGLEETAEGEEEEAEDEEAGLDGESDDEEAESNSEDGSDSDDDSDWYSDSDDDDDEEDQAQKESEKKKKEDDDDEELPYPVDYAPFVALFEPGANGEGAGETKPEETGMTHYVKYSMKPTFATYFRTRYSDDLYRRLMGAIRAKSFEPLSRLQLLDDANAMVKAQLISAEIFAGLMEAYADEDNSAVLIEMLIASKTLAAAAADVPGSEKAFAAVKHALERFYETSNKFASSGSETLIEQRARRVITTDLITSQANQQVIEDALKAYDESAGGNNVALFLREPVYTAIVVSNSEKTGELLSKLSATKSYDEKVRLVVALSQSKDKEVLSKLKSWLESSEVLGAETIKPYLDTIQAKLV